MSTQVWTEQQIRALGARTDGVTACRIVYGVGRTKAYELLRSGQVDFKIIKVPGSNRYVVPVSAILRLLSDSANDP
jgi:hypothetical protein